LFHFDMYCHYKHAYQGIIDEKQYRRLFD